jgi:hypothetical protein
LAISIQLQYISALKGQSRRDKQEVKSFIKLFKSVQPENIQNAGQATITIDESNGRSISKRSKKFPLHLTESFAIQKNGGTSECGANCFESIDNPEEGWVDG